MTDVNKQVEELQKEVDKLKEKKSAKWFYPFLLAMTVVVAWYSPKIVDAAVEVMDTLTSFTSGDVISSSEMNDNFTAISEKISDIITLVNTNESDVATNSSDIATNSSDIATNSSNIATNSSDIATNSSDIASNSSSISDNSSNIAAIDPTASLVFPDGMGGGVVNVRINDSNAYTVTTGKNLYITGLYGTASNYFFQIENYGGAGYYDHYRFTGTNHINMPLPIIVAGGKIVKTSDTRYATITGFEATATVTPINVSIGTAPTTISTTKDAFLFSAYNTGSMNNDLFSGSLFYLRSATSNSAEIFNNPIIIEANKALQADFNNLNVTGYLK